MLRNKLVRSDGSIIDSSVIISCEYTEDVNSTTNLTVGNVTASELIVEILSADVIQQDEVVTYYIIEDDVETKIGVFNAEKPTVATRTSMRFSAYDNIVKTEKNFSDWLRENQSLFPMTLRALARYACSHCGVALAATDFPHSDLSVNFFYADDITCRQILNWAASIAGRFVRANADGDIEFAWYVDATNVTVSPSKSESEKVTVSVIDDGDGNLSISSDDITVMDDGAGNVIMTTQNLATINRKTGVVIAPYVTMPYFQGSLTYENYTTDFIERVQINHSEDDVGVIYPAEADGNCFTISENMILGVSTSGVATQVATDLYNLLKDITYVPFSVKVPRSIHVRAGDIVNLIDPNGKSFMVYVMKVSVTSGGTVISATGDKSYGSSVAVSSEKYSNLTGKILAISKTVEGLVIENKDLAGKVGSMELTSEQFKTYLADTYVTEDEFGAYKSDISTQFTQTATDFEMKFGNVISDIAGVNQDLQDKYRERTSYIKFTDGSIYLGRSDSDVMLILKNDKMSFVRNVSGYPEIAYISDDILYITEGEFLTQLRIGKFGFMPGANGSLSFRKVVD